VRNFSHLEEPTSPTDEKGWAPTTALVCHLRMSTYENRGRMQHPRVGFTPMVEREKHTCPARPHPGNPPSVVARNVPEDQIRIALLVLISETGSLEFRLPIPQGLFVAFPTAPTSYPASYTQSARHPEFDEQVGIYP